MSETDLSREGHRAQPPVAPHEPTALAPAPQPGRRMTAAEIIAETDREARTTADPGDGRRPVATVAAVPPSVVAAEPEPALPGAGQRADETPVGPSGPAARGKVRIGDRAFQGLTTGAGLLIVVLIAAVAVFLVVRAWPAIRDDQQNFLLSRGWSVNTGTLRFGVLDLLWVTVISSVIAMVLAVPVGIGIALFITQYAPRRLAGPVAAVIDLLAAIPSIVYGIWGLLVFGPAIQPVATAVADAVGFVPLFADEGIRTRTIFTAGVVLAIMILPIITAVSRDVFERTPRANIEASLALGATRWEMIRMSVLPYGKAGVVSGAMLGLGRALGETIAVTLILATVGAGSAFDWSIFSGGSTFASKIALNAGEFSNPTQTGAYIAAGLVLFVLTFAVNAGARLIVNRGTNS